MHSSTLMVLTAMAALGATVSDAPAQGPLGPPGAPDPTMKTLQQIWDRLEEIQAQTERNEWLMLEIANAQGLHWQRTWDTVTVDGDNVGWYSSLAFSPGGQPCIAYGGALPEYVRYAAYDGSTWQIADVDTGAEMKHFTSLAFSPSGDPAIAYWPQNPGELRYAEFTTNWTVSVVDPTEGEYPSLAFSPSGVPCISYYDRGRTDLSFARYNKITRTWDIEPVVRTVGDVGLGTSLAFTPAGHPAIAYAHSTDDEIHYIEHDGSDWGSPVLAGADATTHLSLAFTSDGRPAISYYYSPARELRYSESNGAIFQGTTVDTNDFTGTHNSLAFSPDGNPAISYYDDLNNQLKFAEYFDGSWHVSTVQPDENGGKYSSLAFTPDGSPAISHYYTRLMYTVADGYTVAP